MKHDVCLSICIPVYNCGNFLGQALDSILPQIDERVEVIVFDGGSSDGTKALVAPYVESYSNLHYHYSPRRGGIDLDMAKCASFATGEYIWLFSGDDVMRPGAISRALSWIQSGEDVYLCEHTICDRDLRWVRAYPMLAMNATTYADLSVAKERLTWFALARTTEPFFSFMSSILVRRNKWDSGNLDENFVGSCWGHVARLFGLIESGLRICHVSEVWLDMRGGNDSFLDKGIVNRYRIAIEGYQNLGNTYFGRDSQEAFHIRRVLRTEFSIFMFMHAKRACVMNPNLEDKVLLDKLVKLTNSDNSIKERLSLLLYCCPLWVYESGKYLYRVARYTTTVFRRCMQW